MRAAVGLVGLLIGLGVIVYIMGAKGGLLDHQKATIDAGNKATEQVNQLAGRDRTDGTPARQSAALEAQQTNGKINSILVTAIVADGAYARFWGLQRSDSIIEIGPLSVKELITDTGAANDFVQDAYQRHQSLVVIRNGQKTTLDPLDAPTGSGSPLDAMQKIPTH